MAERSSLDRTSSMVTSKTAVSSQTGFRSPKMIRVEYKGLPNCSGRSANRSPEWLRELAHLGIGQHDVRVRLSVTVLCGQVLGVVYGDDKDTDGGSICETDTLSITARMCGPHREERLTTKSSAGKHLLQVQRHRLGRDKLGRTSRNGHINKVGDHCKARNRVSHNRASNSLPEFRPDLLGKSSTLGSLRDMGIALTST
jgi:hypothetical protein